MSTSSLIVYLFDNSYTCIYLQIMSCQHSTPCIPTVVGLVAKWHYDFEIIISPEPQLKCSGGYWESIGYLLILLKYFGFIYYSIYNIL